MRKGLLAMATVLLAACATDSYDSGTGKFSLTQADFVEAHTTSDNAVDYVLTDNGEKLTLTQRKTAAWIDTADTLYRAILYYNKVSNTEAEPVSLSRLPVLSPVIADSIGERHTDPVKFESMWISNNGRYINIGFYMKNGTTDAEPGQHTVGMMYEGERDNADGTRTVRLRLYHDQGDVPEYYSSKYYVSIACSGIDADSVSIAINTYDGPIERRVKLH